MPDGVIDQIFQDPLQRVPVCIGKDRRGRNLYIRLKLPFLQQIVIIQNGVAADLREIFPLQIERKIAGSDSDIVK